MDLTSFFTYSFQSLIDLTSGLAPIWAPIVFGFFFWKIWIYYIQTDYISKMKWIMLEVRLPREVYKPPQAMEFVLSALDQGSGGSKAEQYWTGRVLPWFSLEIASIEGELRFFVRTQSKFKDLVESRIYSQYSEAEIIESPDYTELVDYSRTGGVGMFGSEFVLSKADPLPIKTYVNYGMDRGFLDEKQRFDPMTPMLEFLGSVGKGEHVWIQILVKSPQKRYKKEDGKLGDWRDEARDTVKKMTQGEKKELKEGERPERPQLSKMQSENISDIERNMSKVGLDCGIRMIYLAKMDRFNPGQIASMMSSFKQFNSAELNGFKPKNDTGMDYPWENLDKKFGGFITGKKKTDIFDAYRRRSFFYPPHKRKPFVLTVEELATIFRFPSAIAETPTLKRLESKKAEPPSNLPV